MAWYGYGGYGSASIHREYEQECIGFGPQGCGVYEQDVQVNQNPYTGATSVIRENEFVPLGGDGGGFSGYGYGGSYGYRFL